MSTPRFLDALTTVADSLFLIPRDRRLQELRRQLRWLELEFLPSNDIYIPLKNSYHRVWRIVADESIAISTKERVPCIIYLEVVDYTVKKPSEKEVSKPQITTSPWMSQYRAIVRMDGILPGRYSERGPGHWNVKAYHSGSIHGVIHSVTIHYLTRSQTSLKWELKSYENNTAVRRFSGFMERTEVGMIPSKSRKTVRRNKAKAPKWTWKRV